MPERYKSTAAAASLAAQNVFPPTRKVVSQSYISGMVVTGDPPLGIDPSAVQLHEASGGFNCVIEVSAQRCLRQLAPQLTVAPITLAVSPEVVQDVLAALGRPGIFDDFAVEVLSEFASVDRPVNDVEYFSVLRVEPTVLAFADPHKTTVTLKAEVLHYARITPVPTIASFA